MRLSVVVVTFNSAACVGAAVDSVARALPQAEIVAVDNASEDDTIAVLSSRPAVRVLSSPQNVGFGRACNQGAEAAGGTHLLFLNPDVVVTEADEGRLRPLGERKPFGLIAPVLTRTDRGRERVEGGKLESHWLWDYLSATWLTLWPRELPLPTGARTNGRVDWVSAALLLADAGEFRRLGGFDPRFFLYYEDRDLSARYRAAGLPVGTTNALAGRHSGSSSSPRDDLSVEALTWALLGWLEYLYVHRGEATARRATGATVHTLRLQAGSIRLARRGAPRSPRLARKSEQLDALLASLRGQAARNADDYCPEARRLLAEAWSLARARA